MKKYKLLKDINHPSYDTIKAGTIFSKPLNACKDTAYANKGVNIVFHPDRVENNPEWFEEVDMMHVWVGDFMKIVEGFLSLRCPTDQYIIVGTELLDELRDVFIEQPIFCSYAREEDGGIALSYAGYNLHFVDSVKRKQGGQFTHEDLREAFEAGKSIMVIDNFIYAGKYLTFEHYLAKKNAK